MSKPKSPWRPIRTAPRDVSYGIIVTNGTGYSSATWDRNLGSWFTDRSILGPLTHWMPIPPLPERER